MPRPRVLAAAALLALLLGACGGSSAASPATAPGGVASGGAVAPPPAASAPAATLSPGSGLGALIGLPDTPVAGRPPADGSPWFLAVGDSITSGYTLDRSRSGTNSSWALLLQDRLAARGQPWSLYDTACPGETLESYAARCSGRLLIPFLVAQSQRDAAMAAIAAHRADLKLILVDLGSNDLLRAERSGGDPASAGPALVAALDTVVGDLQRAAPGVPLVLCTFYNPLAASRPATEPQLAVINGDLAALAAGHGALLADFHAAVNGPGQDLCALVDCADRDIHPTIAGQQHLADAALAAVPPPPPVA